MRQETSSTMYVKIANSSDNWKTWADQHFKSYFENCVLKLSSMAETAPGTWTSPGCDGDDAWKSERRGKQTRARESVYGQFSCVFPFHHFDSRCCFNQLVHGCICSISHALTSPASSAMLLSPYSTKSSLTSLNNTSVNSALQLNLTVFLKFAPKNSTKTFSHQCLSSSR